METKKIACSLEQAQRIKKKNPKKKLTYCPILGIAYLYK